MDSKSFIRNNKKTLILDGAIGSLLQQKGFLFDEHLWTINANLQNPLLVKEIYREYVSNGADIITTNTFRTNPIAFKKSQLNISNRDFVKAAVTIAIEAKGENTLIAGSNPPAEDSYKTIRDISETELIDNHHTHIDFLWESNVDFILNETMSHLDEIIISADYCSKKNIPFVTSLFFYDELKILSGENLLDVIEILLEYDPIIISFNCVSLSSFKKLSEFIDLSNFYFGFYLNCGSGNFTDKEITCGVTPKNYAEFVEPFLNLNPKIIGNCCGSNPNHTKELRNIIDEVYRN